MVQVFLGMRSGVKKRATLGSEQPLMAIAGVVVGPDVFQVEIKHSWGVSTVYDNRYLPVVAYLNQFLHRKDDGRWGGYMVQDRQPGFRGYTFFYCVQNLLLGFQGKRDMRLDQFRRIPITDELDGLGNSAVIMVGGQYLVAGLPPYGTQHGVYPFSGVTDKSQVFWRGFEKLRKRFNRIAHSVIDNIHQEPDRLAFHLVTEILLRFEDCYWSSAE